MEKYQLPLGNFLKAIRRGRKFSESEFCLKLKLSNDQLNNIENGGRLPTSEELDKYIKKFNLSAKKVWTLLGLQRKLQDPEFINNCLQNEIYLRLSDLTDSQFQKFQDELVTLTEED